MRNIVSLALAVSTGLFGFAAAMGLTGSLFAAGVIAAVVAALAFWATLRHPVIALDETACSRGLAILALLSTVAAIGMVARQTVFAVDATRVSYSLIPSSDWETQHSCLSAYAVAGEAS
jgi:hypothetical protein